MCVEELDLRMIILSPDFADGKAIGVFFESAHQMAILVDQLIASNSDFAAAVARLNLYRYNFCIDALRLAKELLVNPGTFEIPTPLN